MLIFLKIKNALSNFFYYWFSTFVSLRHLANNTRNGKLIYINHKEHLEKHLNEYQDRCNKSENRFRQIEETGTQILNTTQKISQELFEYAQSLDNKYERFIHHLEKRHASTERFLSDRFGPAWNRSSLCDFEEVTSREKATSHDGIVRDVDAFETDEAIRPELDQSKIDAVTAQNRLLFGTGQDPDARII